MEITKVVKTFIRRGANTFGNIVYLSLYLVIILNRLRKMSTVTFLKKL